MRRSQTRQSNLSGATSLGCLHLRLRQGGHRGRIRGLPKSSCESLVAVPTVGVVTLSMKTAISLACRNGAIGRTLGSSKSTELITTPVGTSGRLPAGNSTSAPRSHCWTRSPICAWGISFSKRLVGVLGTHALGVLNTRTDATRSRSPLSDKNPTSLFCDRLWANRHLPPLDV